jgi:hypothetical protein
VIVRGGRHVDRLLSDYAISSTPVLDSTASLAASRAPYGGAMLARNRSLRLRHRWLLSINHPQL